MQTQMHGCFQEGMKGRPCKPPPGHRSIDYDFQHLDVGIPVVNRDPSICEGHVRPRDERASAGSWPRPISRANSRVSIKQEQQRERGAKMEVVQER